MMAEGELVATRFNSGVVERSASQIRAKGAGIFFFSRFKNHVIKIGFLYDVFNAVLFAELLNFGEIAAFVIESVIKRNGFDFKRNGIKTPQLGKGAQQHNRILAAGNADGDTVVFVYHIVFLRSGADKRKNVLHKIPL